MPPRLLNPVVGGIFVSGGFSSMTFVERFWEHVEQGSGCWLWHGSRNDRGYGIAIVMSPGDPSVPLHMKAHRLSYLLHYGPPPQDQMVLHHCDNPPCVNPDHLYLGTHADNVRDREERRRNHQSNKTHCNHGHPYDAANTYVVPRTGHRQVPYLPCDVA